MNRKKRLTVIGGGAAGFFGAIAAAERNPDLEVHILEGSNKVLSKVLVSGGGRCNVTHACWEPKELVKFYPRGQKALLGPFHKFCTGDTYGWFEDRGVSLKIEDDGRVFPVSDKSSSIANALEEAAGKAGVKVHLQSRVVSIAQQPDGLYPWVLGMADGTQWHTDAILAAGGGTPALWELFQSLGHSIVPPVPSLFTFNIKDPRIATLPGLSVPNAKLNVKEAGLAAEGPLLITHWGLSGPAVLKLSAWGARLLAELDYKFTLQVDWLGVGKLEKAAETLRSFRNSASKKAIASANPFGMPARWWSVQAATLGIEPDRKWADATKGQMDSLVENTAGASYAVNGKSTFKEEFVTAGGIHLDEVDFRTFGSKLLPNVFFAGEMLDIDALTGGFNFQAAWTGGWIAGNAIAEGN